MTHLITGNKLNFKNLNGMLDFLNKQSDDDFIEYAKQYSRETKDIKKGIGYMVCRIKEMTKVHKVEYV